MSSLPHTTTTSITTSSLITCLPNFSNHFVFSVDVQLGTDKIEQRLARMEKESGEGKEKSESKDKEKPDSKEKEKDKESADDPQFVKDLLALHDKFINVVNSEFCGNALFQKALKDAFVEVTRREETRGDPLLYHHLTSSTTSYHYHHLLLHLNAVQRVVYMTSTSTSILTLPLLA